MATPTSGEISFGNLKSELSTIGGASANISLGYMAYDVMGDGFYDTFGFVNQVSYSTGPVSLSYFYDLHAFGDMIFSVDASVIDYDLFSSVLTNQSKAGGGIGPYESPTNFNNPSTGTISPNTTSGINITHMQQLQVNVMCINNSARPPFADLYMDWNDSSGFIAFAGSPFNGPSLNVSSGIQQNAPNSPSTFEVRCYQ